MDQEKLRRRVVPHERGAQNNGPSQKTAIPRWSFKGREKNSIELACTWIVEHQIGISSTLLSLLFATHVCVPEARHHTRKFFSISYYNAQTNKFAGGWDDLYFVVFWITCFTGLRCVVMDYLLLPLAGWAGIRKKKPQVRFAEQTWILIYAGAFWFFDMYIMCQSDYWYKLDQLWADFPTREIDGLVKWYYLVQFAFWVQQIVVVNIEERRKDYAQMFTHHVVTCALMFASYGYHQTKVGNLILCLMDGADVFLPLAKILRYLGHTTLCDVTFGIFMVEWFILRHAWYMLVCWSIYSEVPKVMNYGCFRGSDANLEGPLPIPHDWNHLLQPFYDPEGLICMDDKIRLGFLSLLLVLQAILLLWFGMIIKVAYKVINGQGADDVRSDAEDSEEEMEADPVLQSPLADIPEPAEKAMFIEQEVSVENMHQLGPSRSGSKGGRGSPARRLKRTEGASGNTAGMSVRPSDRKDLLGRIGCDKGS